MYACYYNNTFLHITQQSEKMLNIVNNQKPFLYEQQKEEKYCL